MKREVPALAGFILLSFAAGGIGSIWTAPAVPTWYAGLEKPAWNPPGWVFGPVWSALYLLMGVAAFLVWRQAGFTRAIGFFLAQLVLNAAWSWIFFGLKQPAWAFAEIVVLWAFIAATLLAFGSRSRPAAWLMAPYLGWVSFASALNFAIWRMNT